LQELAVLYEKTKDREVEWLSSLDDADLESTLVTPPLDFIIWLKERPRPEWP
jgi:hypothetical protein